MSIGVVLWNLLLRQLFRPCIDIDVWGTWNFGWNPFGRREKSQKARNRQITDVNVKKKLCGEYICLAKIGLLKLKLVFSNSSATTKKKFMRWGDRDTTAVRWRWWHFWEKMKMIQIHFHTYTNSTVCWYIRLAYLAPRNWRWPVLANSINLSISFTTKLASFEFLFCRLVPLE